MAPLSARKPGRPRKLISPHENRVHVTRRSSRHGDDGDYRIKVELSSAAPPRTRRSDAHRAALAPEVTSTVIESPAPQPTHTNGLLKDQAVENDSAAVAQIPPLDEAFTLTSVRPKRIRQPTRRKASPVPITSSPPSRAKVDPAQASEPVHAEPPLAPEIESTPLGPAPQPSLKTKLPGRTSGRKRLNTTSLDHTSDTGDLSTPKRSAAPIPSSPSRGSGPSIASTKPDATPTLKIRLPRLGTLNFSSGSVPSSSTAIPEKNRGDTSAQQRRRSRRQMSSVSMNGASASSDGGSMSVSAPGTGNTSETSS